MNAPIWSGALSIARRPVGISSHFQPSCCLTRAGGDVGCYGQTILLAGLADAREIMLDFVVFHGSLLGNDFSKQQT